MKLLIVAVGHKMPAWVNEGYTEYAKRMPREARIELVEIKPEKRAGGKTREQVHEAERQRIVAALPANCELLALDERGQEWSTLELAEALKGWMQGGRDVAFVIGGADGLHPELKRRAGRLWSLTRLTLPHGLVRVVLAEQLYRAATVIQNHPYHRE
ncbi:MAG: 23S rRNA (pseudouridine(1915)-N(3))-methyltransferase RlmH [Sulfuricella sp.]|nr:23S rRNA (pseudouridine(1915)-N(3))-methyltransferase RlmH [Gammaproteobacteria bacterium]